MSEAITVVNLYKKFEKRDKPFWQVLLHRNRQKDGNGKNGKAALPTDLELVASQNGTGSANLANSPGEVSPVIAYGRRVVVAVDHVTFSVQEGEIFGVLGPNGSGKSTLIRLIATLLLPDAGELRVFGYDVVKKPRQVQELINRVSVEASFFKKLSPMENLLYGARLYGMSGAETRRQVVKILIRLGLDDRSIYNPMEEMSRGMQQKVAIARALLSRPRLLLLDEPTTGLDPRSKREVQAVVNELRSQGTTILLTTHDMYEADLLCDRVAIIDGGKIVVLDTPQGLKNLIQKDGVEATLEDVFLELTGKKLGKEEDQVPVG
jgi:ABC-2 type transport system ATP-binding protein